MISSINSVKSTTSFRGAEVDVVGALSTLGEIGKLAEDFNGDSTSFNAAEKVMNKIGDNVKNPVVSKVFKVGGSLAGLVVGIFAYKKIAAKTPVFVGNLVKKIKGEEVVKITGAQLDEIAAKNSKNLTKFLEGFKGLKNHPKVRDGIHGVLTTLGLDSTKNVATTVLATTAAVATESGVLKLAEGGDSKEQAKQLEALVDELEEKLALSQEEKAEASSAEFTDEPYEDDYTEDEQAA